MSATCAPSCISFLIHSGLFRKKPLFIDVYIAFRLEQLKEELDRAKLVNDLLSGYNPWARPRIDPRETVNIWFFMYLYFLNDVESFHFKLE